MGRHKRYITQADKQRAYRLRRGVTKNHKMENIVTRLAAVGWTLTDDHMNWHLRGPQYGISFRKEDWHSVVEQVGILEARAANPEPVQIIDIWKRKKNGETHDPDTNDS